MGVFAKAFIAGLISTLVFHQGLFALLAMVVPNAPPAYNMEPTGPLAVPTVMSLAFWGGVWAIGIWAIVSRLSGMARWLLTVVLGAVGPTVVSMLIVFPLKGLPVELKIWFFALLLNAAWGLGLAVCMAVLHRPTEPNNALS